MNRRAFTLSLIIAGLAMAMVYSYMEGQKKMLIERYGNEVTVIVAKEDIKAFETLSDRNVMAQTIPSEFRAPGFFNKIEDLQNTIALVPILKGEQITAPRVSYPDGSTGLSRQVSKDKRAVSIRVSDDQAVSKLIKPGDRVDILARIDFGGGRKDLQKISTILQDVLILSTGVSITNSLPLVGLKENNKVKEIKNLRLYTDYNTITLELFPHEAQKLLFQMDVLGARPYFTLRNNNDKTKVVVRPTKLYDVLGDDTDEVKDYFKKQNNPRGGKSDK